MAASPATVKRAAADRAPRRAPSARSAAAGRAAAHPAPARRATSTNRRASAARRSSSGARRSRITPPGGIAMIPVHAVGGAAGAVGGIANSGLVVGMTRGRLWIAVLAGLLGGIVALNVWGLSLSASTSGTATKIDELERANTVLEAKIAKLTADDRVQAVASGLGLATPTPKGIRYLKARPADAQTAASRIASGQVSILDAVAPAFVEAAAQQPAPVAADPAAAVAPPPAVEPATAAPVDPTVTTPPPVAPAPPATAPPTAPVDGGVTP
jgi:hypothetical protein